MDYQKQQPRGVLKKRCSENMQQIYRRKPLQSNFIEIALRHGCSLANLLHIFRTPFPRNTSAAWLLLDYYLIIPCHNLTVNKPFKRSIRAWCNESYYFDFYIKYCSHPLDPYLTLVVNSLDSWPLLGVMSACCHSEMYPGSPEAPRRRLYALIMLHTRFRVNLHSVVGWVSRNSLFETGTISEVQVTATRFESTTT